MRLLEEQVAWVWIGYMKLVTGVMNDRLLRCMGADFIAGSLARVGSRDRTWRPGIEVGSVEELMEVIRIAENV